MAYSKYPNQIDTSTELPIAVDRKTQVIAEVVNRLRSAILAVEGELGIKPSREYGSVRARLDEMMNMIASGPVLGPAVSTDNAVVRWDGVLGTVTQNSTVIIDDSGNTTVPGYLRLGTTPALGGDVRLSGADIHCSNGTTERAITQSNVATGTLVVGAGFGYTRLSAGPDAGYVICDSSIHGTSMVTIGESQFNTTIEMSNDNLHLTNLTNMVWDSSHAAVNIYIEDDAVGVGSVTMTIHGQDMLGLGSYGGNLHLRPGVGAASDGYLELQDAGGLPVIAITPDAKVQLSGNFIMVGDYSIVPYLDDIGNIGAPGRRFSLVRARTITSGDIGFDDESCPMCNGPFEVGDEIVMKVMKKEDDFCGRDIIYTVPTHLKCTNG